MPEVVEKIIQEINANMKMDELAAAAFTAGLSAGITIGRITAEKDEEKK